MDHLEQQLPAKKAIEQISLDILKGSKSLGVFPTPVDRIVNFSDLIIANGIDIKSLQTKFKDYPFNEALISGLSKVRGFLDRSGKTIYLDTVDQSIQRQNFVKLHEAGHGALPWQKSTLQFVDDDDSLDPSVKEEFEREANFFASLTLFQHDLFNHELNKLSLSIDSPMKLAKMFGASVHAALRRYIEHSKNRCALLVLENISPPGTQCKCTVRNKFQSAIFSDTFGQLIIPETLGYKWAFVQDYYFQKKMTKTKNITLTTENGEADFIYQFFNNTYNAFVFIYPIGEKKSVIKKIVAIESFVEEKPKKKTKIDKEELKAKISQ